MLTLVSQYFKNNIDHQSLQGKGLLEEVFCTVPRSRVCYLCFEQMYFVYLKCIYNTRLFVNHSTK